jgi:NAD(P)-dependent dehydrogenase (short-subunit alcohol dehydrogenase family)
MHNGFDSFPPHCNVLVFGAGGAIGGALVRALQNRYTVTALMRGDGDVSDEAAMAALADKLANKLGDKSGDSPPFHLIINATGLLHDAAGLMPEKAMKQIEGAKMARIMAVNAIGPALICKYFVPLMARDSKAVMAHLSARVGSISDNRLGGWTSYRAAKAAQNMIVKNAAIETARRDPQKILVGLHPGTVDSRLSAPFQTNVSEGKLFTPDQAATHLLAVIDRLSADDSGYVFAWDGTKIPA